MVDYDGLDDDLADKIPTMKAVVNTDDPGAVLAPVRSGIKPSAEAENLRWRPPTRPQ